MSPAKSINAVLGNWGFWGDKSDRCVPWNFVYQVIPLVEENLRYIHLLCGPNRTRINKHTLDDDDDDMLSVSSDNL